LIRFENLATRPFMLDSIYGFEPNNYYRPWLESNVGEQFLDWNWELDPTDSGDLLRIYFKNKEDAILFELVWPHR